MKLVLSGLKQLHYLPDAPGESGGGPGLINTDVLACAICRTDAKMWAQGHRDLVFPRVPGHEMVVRDGSGRRHVVWPGSSCGRCGFCSSGRENLCEEMKITGFHSDGGFADTALLPEKSLIPLPDTIDDQLGCFAEPVGCVVNAFEKVGAKAGGRVLIIGGGTLGLITALYGRFLGLYPVVIEKSETKIEHITPFITGAGIPCVKESSDSEFDVVISCCADHIAFCQGITKVAKGGSISFFSGLAKNEHVETNLLNLIHYREVRISGAYGMTSEHMRRGLPFMEKEGELLKLLIEEIVRPEAVPGLMEKVLAGTGLKLIIDFSGAAPNRAASAPAGKEALMVRTDRVICEGLCGEVINAIEPLTEALHAEAVTKMDNKTKPLGSLGRLEPLAVKMSRIQNTLLPQIRHKQMLVFAADHGVTEEGVSAFPKEVTAQMVENFLNGGAAINVLCRHQGIDLKITDMGVAHDFSPHPDLIEKKVARGTRNFAIGDAMTREEMLTALENGIQVFFEAEAHRKIDIVGLGEMGIGNTTSAAAIIAAVTKISAADAAGRGTGVDDHGLRHKIEVIQRTLDFHQVDGADGFAVLQKLGGFEIAGMAGAALAAASRGCAVVLDGVISTAAGLIAYLINPDVGEYLISGHKSVEKSQAAALSHMGLVPLLDLDMRLGEGTGAALAIDLADAACRVMREMASFDDAKVARSEEVHLKSH